MLFICLVNYSLAFLTQPWSPATCSWPSDLSNSKYSSWDWACMIPIDSSK